MQSPERLLESLQRVGDALHDLEQSNLSEEREVERGNLADRLRVLIDLVQSNRVSPAVEAAIDMLCDDYLDFADALLKKPG